MIRTVGGMLVLLALAPAFRAGDKADKLATPAEQYKAIVADYDKVMADYNKALSEAKTPQDREKVEWPTKKVDAIKARLLKLAENNPKDPISVDALILVVRKSPWWAGNDPESPCVQALTMLARDHVRSDKLRSLVELLSYALDDASQTFLRAVMDKNPNREIQGKACLVLAQQAEYRLQRAEDFKDYPDRAKRSESVYGKKIVEELVKANLDKLRKEAAARYERVLKDYGDLSAGASGTMKQLAEIKLESLRHPILVGKPVPDIEGEDLDGQKFKLSDYRGKVVLLDFWGNW